MNRVISEQGKAPRNLWAAVLEQSILDIRDGKKKYKSKANQRDARIHADQAKAWFLSGRLAPGSFVWICNALDITPSKVRDRIFG